MAAPAAAEGSLVPLMGACEAAVAAEDVAPLEAVTPMRLQGETWIGEAGGLTVLFTPPVDAMYAVAGLTPATCSILAWADDGETLVPWSDVAPVVAGWARGLSPDAQGSYLREVCDGPGAAYVAVAGPDRGGYAGIGELDPPAVRMEVAGIGAEECGHAD